ncbi:MAG: glycosyltransferase [Velocimicrobium sp.]
MKGSILFIVMNGDGLGHLTRALAVAKRLRNLCFDFEIVFYTTSLATKIVRDLGFLYYDTHVRERMPKQTPFMNRKIEIQTQLEVILDIHHPTIVVFDGAYPGTAILTPLMNEGTIKKLWIKREGDRPNMKAFDVYEKYFDFILVPKEVGLEYSDTSKKKQYFSPILLLDKTESYKRYWVRERFGLKEENRLWYVQLGNDETDNKKRDVTFLLNHLLQNKKNVILLGESILNASLNLAYERVITIRNYPNSIYFEGIDFAVSAAGYNTVHELLAFKVPSIFIPNKRVVKDDQLARAKRAQAMGVGIAMNHTYEFLEVLTTFENTYEKFRSNLENVQFENGALQVAEYMVKQMSNNE